MQRPRYGDLFAAPEVSDLPLKLRAIIEDNCVLKEKTRKYRAQCHQAAAERDAALKELGPLAAKKRELEQKLSSCSVSSDEIQAYRVRIKLS